MKRSPDNPYFALDLEAGYIKDEYLNGYSIEEFREFVNNSQIPLDMTMMVQRLISFDYDIDKLREFYKNS